MAYALFLGCTVPTRNRAYELSTRKVARALGIPFSDLEKFICCGFPVSCSDPDTSQIMAAYNICLAAEKGVDICTLCSSCASHLTLVSERLKKDPSEKKRANKRLSRVGLSLENGTEIRHFAQVLCEDNHPDRLKEGLKKDLSGLKVAVHYGCHYFKPLENDEGLAWALALKPIESLIALTGAHVVRYPGEKRCCGGPLLPVDEELGLLMAKEKLEAVRESGADLLCLVCPSCFMMYGGAQKTSRPDSRFLPVFYLTQLLGLALGIEARELGMRKGDLQGLSEPVRQMLIR